MQFSGFPWQNLLMQAILVYLIWHAAKTQKKSNNLQLPTNEWQAEFTCITLHVPLKAWRPEKSERDPGKFTPFCLKYLVNLNKFCVHCKKMYKNNKKVGCTQDRKNNKKVLQP